MSWSALAARFPTLPLILTGPIVRRTEPDNVTVWVAVKERCTVTLRVYERDDLGELCERFLGTRHTIRLGDHLHLVAVTARAETEEHSLECGQLYYYNLFFETDGSAEHPVSSTAPSLLTAGILVQDPQSADDLQRLVYAGHPLPSFVLPSPDLDTLRIMHGSCRNPSGRGRESLSTLDLILEGTNAAPLQRPQMLFLTGDQIYADDVATPLLFALIDAGDFLRAGNEDEVLPLVEKRARMLPPGGRQEAVLEKARFTTTTPGSHLLSLAEYIAMYLFTWSDVLWPEEIPSIRDLWESYPHEKPASTISQKRKSWKYRLQVYELGEFRATLPKVRRALANIATYMIFDDHDVTDDWYLDGAWCKNVLDSVLGRRVIRNALLAYALCQGWGNDPDQFEAPKGQEFLNAVSAWRGNENDSDAERIIAHLGVPSAFSGYGELEAPAQALDWHYTLKGLGYQVMILDSRTKRTYPRPHSPPGLLSPRAVEQQIAAKEAEIAIVVSPTPILAVRFIGRLQLWNRLWKDNYDLEFESWALERETLQRVLQALGQLERVLILSGDVHYGFASSLEYWEYTKDAIRTAKFVDYTASPLKNTTSGVSRIILILGSLRMFQLFSRGELSPYNLLTWDSGGRNAQVVHQALEAIRADWRRPWRAVPRLVAVLRSPFALMLPAEGWPAQTFDHFPPNRRYRLSYLRSESGQSLPQARLRPALKAVGTDLSADLLVSRRDPEGQASTRAGAGRAVYSDIPAVGGRERLVRAAKYVKNIWVSKWTASPNLVWEANLGDIGFDWANKEVTQKLWWHPADNPRLPLPLTQYRESLEPPTIEAAPTLPDSDPMPSPETRAWRWMAAVTAGAVILGLLLRWWRKRSRSSPH